MIPPLTTMCLFPRFIKNKRYTGYKLKKGDIECDDYRKLYVPIGCGKCFECKKQKAQQWRVRLSEELKVQKFPYFITLTFSNESLEELMKKCNSDKPNKVACEAVRLFLERYRKKYGVSLRHWFITELGQENTERIHLHGIIFPPHPMTNEELQSLWKYGRSDIGEYCNLRTINYIIKYVTKVDTTHKSFNAQIFCSAGLGENFVHTYAAQMTYRFRKGQTPEYYTLNNGRKVALPIYYRNKFFSQRERDKLWTERLDKGEIYVNGIRIRNVDTEKGQKLYEKTLRSMQEWNNKLGYGNLDNIWYEDSYKITFKMLQKAANK